MNLDINKKIAGIMQSATLDELPLKYLPPVSDTPDKYYFVSYSHKDYKQVYADIFALQSEGINLWYDRAMSVGVSWKETAEKYIRPSRCAGVIFYVSENSLLSPAIHEEIAFAKQCGKSCLTINLPMQDGKTFSAKEMLNKLIANGVDVPNDKYDFISQVFNDDVLYLPYSATAERKAEKILGLKNPPLLNFGGFGSIVLSTNDIDITQLKNNDFIYEEAACDSQAVDDFDNQKIYFVERIYDCAFANCKWLRSVELPDTVLAIDDYAFYGCKSLIAIDLSRIDELGDYAFSACENLQDLNLLSDSPLDYIPPHAFDGCKSLLKFVIPVKTAEIGEMAFAFSGLRKLIVPDKVSRIGDSAFANCSDLAEINFQNTIEKLDMHCIAQCPSLKRLVIGKNVKSIVHWDVLNCVENALEIIVDEKNATYRVEDGNCVVNKLTNEIEYDYKFETSDEKAQEILLRLFPGYKDKLKKK